MGQIKAKRILLTNVVSPYIELPLGVSIIGDKKYTVEEVANDDQWDGAPSTIKSITKIEDAAPGETNPATPAAPATPPAA